MDSKSCSAARSRRHPGFENQLDVISDAYYIIELEPNGREAGGQLFYQGEIEGLKEAKESVTAGSL